MDSRIEKYIGQEAYKKIVERFNGIPEYEEVFSFYLRDFLKDLEKENDIEEKDTAESLLVVPIDFINHYVKCREEGFSRTWSATQADLEIMMNTNSLVVWCYEEVAKVNKEEALKDLHTFCKTQKGDKVYTEFLIDRVTNDDYSTEPIENLAADYSQAYKKQIEKRKSETYARIYADLFVADYHEIYCEEYATAYEESLNLGKSQEYAELYADKYAGELVDVKRRAHIYDDKESLEFARDKAKAYINGWEYATENAIVEKNVFIDCYSNSYLNTINSDEWTSIEELDKIVLKKALEKFEKRRS